MLQIAKSNLWVIYSTKLKQIFNVDKKICLKGTYLENKIQNPVYTF